MSIRFEHCSKKFGEFTALHQLNFEVKKGEIFGYLGPNGAGKSTSIRILLGMLTPSSGQAFVNGLNVVESSYLIRKHVGYLPGEIVFPKGFTAEELVHFSLSIHKKDDAYANELFKKLELDKKRKVHQMSKGMKQKLGIITCLAHDPDILILDEPTTGLDPFMQSIFNDILLEEKAKGKTIFMSSHILSDVEHLCDRIGIINKGKLIFTGTVGQLFENMPYDVTIQADRQYVEELKKTAGVSHVSIEGNRICLKFQPPFQPLLSTLQKGDIRSLTIKMQPIEDVFLHFYRESEDQ